jgi:hypothetical protein
MSVNGTAHVRFYGAQLFEAHAKQLEGCLHVSGNSTVELFNTTIANASTLGLRGGIGVTGNATLNMVRSKITQCAAVVVAGALSVSGNSVATLFECTISENSAGRRDSTQGIPTGTAGGVAAAQSAHLTLIDTSITGNTAAFGGGMVINPSATLLLQGQTVITDNEAWQRAGGVDLLTNSLMGSFADLEKATRNNTAPNDADISLLVDKLQVLGTSSSSGNSTLQAFIPGDILLLNVSIAGPNGRMSNQTVTVALLTAQNASIYTDRLRVNAGIGRQATASARVMIRQPPGELCVSVPAERAE